MALEDTRSRQYKISETLFKKLVIAYTIAFAVLPASIYLFLYDDLQSYRFEIDNQSSQTLAEVRISDGDNSVCFSRVLPRSSAIELTPTNLRSHAYYTIRVEGIGETADHVPVNLLESRRNGLVRIGYQNSGRVVVGAK